MTAAARGRRVVTRRLTRRAAVTIVLAGTYLVGWPTAALAHAQLEQSTPADGAVLLQSPVAISMHFSEPVELALGSIQVIDARGQRADDGAPFHPGGRGRDVSENLKPNLPAGTYLISWRVVSDDSHPVSGQLVFSVGKPGAVPTAASTTGSAAVGLLLGAARFGGFLGLALLLGTALFVLVCWRRGWVDVRVRRLLIVGWATACVATVLALVLQGPYGAGLGLSAVADGGRLHATIGTRFGQAMVVRLWLLLGFAAVITAADRRTRATRGSRADTLTLAPLLAVGGVATGLGLLATVAVAGHADDGTRRWLALPVDVAHLAAMVAWLGGLAVLSVCFLARRAVSPELRTALPRFSRLAAVSVSVLVLTGMFAAWRDLGSWGALTGTRQGVILLIKLGVLGLLLGAALLSRRWLRTRHPTEIDDRWSDVRRLRVSVASETALALSLLAVTAVLVAAPPGRADWRPSSSYELAAGPVMVQLAVVPTGPNRLDVRATTTKRDPTAAAVSQLTATAALPSRAIDGIPVQFVRVGADRFVARGITLPASGRWSLDLLVHTGATQGYATQATVSVH